MFLFNFYFGSWCGLFSLFFNLRNFFFFLFLLLIFYFKTLTLYCVEVLQKVILFGKWWDLQSIVASIFLPLQHIWHRLYNMISFSLIKSDSFCRRNFLGILRVIVYLPFFRLRIGLEKYVNLKKHGLKIVTRIG